MESAFATTIHHYRVNDELHFANASEPSVPMAFQGVVTAIRGSPTFVCGRPGNTSSARMTRLFRQSPTRSRRLRRDLRYQAALFRRHRWLGAKGGGRRATQINLSDIQQFRTYFGLAANDPQVTLVPNARDPGISSDDLTEADLDVEWSGAVARNASILYVYSNDVMDAAQYAIDQNLAPVLSISYGSCEAETSSSDASSIQLIARQANAQGITWFAASGDDGGADCYGGGSRNRNATLSVDLPAGIPEVTGVGGTEFNEGSGSYWGSTNDGNHASALSYIPETTWNDTATDGTPSASGGGASVFFAKPAWQTGTGVPDDGARDVPDVRIRIGQSRWLSDLLKR